MSIYARTIRDAVLALVARNRGMSRVDIRPEMTFHDLGIDGDDAVELIQVLCAEFSIDTSEIDLARYTIGPEGWGFDALAVTSFPVSLKWANTESPTDLRVSDLIQSAEAGKWFDPSDKPNW